MKTSPVLKLMVISLVLLMSAALSAQEKETPKPASTAAPQERTERRSFETARDSYKLEFTLAETEGGRKVNTRTFTVMCEDLGGRTSGHLRIGSRVPVPNAATPGGGPVQFQYMDVGMKIDAFLNTTGDGSLSLSATVDVSSVAEGGAPGPPVVRSMQFSSNTGIVPGKPAVLSTADDLGSNHRFEVQVIATKLGK